MSKQHHPKSTMLPEDPDKAIARLKEIKSGYPDDSNERKRIQEQINRLSALRRKYRDTGEHLDSVGKATNGGILLQ